MKIAILTANLGNFDTLVKPVTQFLEGNHMIYFKPFTDETFPPCVGLTSRLQYRIPKLFGWEMIPDFDIYVWLDGSMSLQREDSISWLLSKLGDADMAFFRHPWRKTIKEEVNHIEEYLQKGDKYITPRYANGFHKEQYTHILRDTEYIDDTLLTSTSFIYRNTDDAKEALCKWWFLQSRYFSCDQVALPYALYRANVKYNIIEEHQFKNPYIRLMSHHK